MTYEVVLTDRALKMLEALDQDLRWFVESRLLDLAELPVALSRPAVSPPHPPGGIIYEFDDDSDPITVHHFGIFFRYSSDETHLVVIAIGHTALDRL